MVFCRSQCYPVRAFLFSTLINLYSYESSATDFGEQDLCDVRFACHSLPMFHAMGMVQPCWAAATGVVLTSFEPKSPAPLLTPDTLLCGARDTKADMIFCVPNFIEAWAQEKESVDYLKGIRGLVFYFNVFKDVIADAGCKIYGGAPLNKSVGDLLVEQGISIFTTYGW